MKTKTIIVGNGKKDWIIRELFWSIINGEIEGVSYIDPYIFPDKRTEDLYWKEYSSQNIRYLRTITAPRWRKYSSINDLDIHEDERVNLLFVYGREVDRLYDPIQLTLLRRRYNNRIRLFLVLFDSINVTKEYRGWGNITDCFDYFDDVASFDSNDARLYNLVHFTTPYTKRNIISGDYLCDIFFVGDEKGRGTILSTIYINCQKNGVNADFRLMNVKEEENIAMGIKRLDNVIPYSNTLELIRNSNCLLELTSEGQSSFSLRYYEAIVYNKKLLSNNRSVLSSPYYKSGFIRYFDSLSDIDFDWVKEIENVNYNYQDEFSERHWISELTNKFAIRDKVFKPSEEDLVSVIIPVYNREGTIVDAVQSVLNQTYTKIECIVVDDGSTDKTLQVLKEAIDDSRLRVYSIENSGACVARNFGIEKSSGNYVAFQDSDDAWQPTKLEKQMQVLKNNDFIDIVFCNAIRSGFEGHKGEYLVNDIVESGPVNRNQLQSKSIVSTQTILARKECFKYEKFDPILPRLQDYDLVIRLAEMFQFYFIYEPLVLINVQDDSISSDPQKAIYARKIILNKYPNIVSRNYAMYSSSIASIRHNAKLLNIEDSNANREWILLKRIKQYNEIIDGQRREIDRFEASISWKVGRIITFIPRKIRYIVKKFSK